MSLLLLPVLIAYSLLKIDIFLNAIADPSKSFNEAVDKLFQRSFVDDCVKMMQTLSLSAYCLLWFEKKKFLVFYCRSIQKLQWSCWRAVSAPFVEKCIEHTVNTTPTCVNCLFCTQKKIFLVSIVDPSKSFNKAVDELFQPISGCKFMEHDVNTIAIYFYCPQLLFHTYLMQICRKTNFYHVGHLPRIIGCTKMTQKVLEIIFFCFKHSLTSY